MRDGSWRNGLKERGNEFGTNPVFRATVLEIDSNEEWLRELQDHTRDVDPDEFYESFSELAEGIRNSRSARND
jgi:hypothetical protein